MVGGAGGAAGSCPDLSSYRSDNVLGHFDPSRLEGLWYESAFIDIAQVGASCRALSASYDAERQVDHAVLGQVWSAPLYYCRNIQPGERHGYVPEACKYARGQVAPARHCHGGRDGAERDRRTRH